ncbi:MAG: hypothetical protein CMJ84_07215 [Planctomycetes bacterium]|jgi:hypothetical protein|nr:hypothetical protein [Planctomycetota bacterium]MDP6409513.1 hypothetical protein [Planctomycetota bacterium]
MIQPITLAFLAISTFSAAAGVQAKHLEFQKRFEQAMAINSTTEMSRLVKSSTPEAVDWIMKTAEGISTRNSEKLETRMAALQTAWRSAMETDFCDKMYEYFSFLDGHTKKERARMRSEYDKFLADYLKNLEKKDGPTFELLGQRYEALADGFDEIGDHFYTSQCSIFVGNCRDEANRGKRADLYKVTAALKRAVSEREAIGLKDRPWMDCNRRYQYLAKQGYDRAKPTEEEAKAEATPKASEPALTAAMGFELVEKPSAFQRPMYYLDSLYPLWNSIYLTSKGTSFRFLTLEAGPDGEKHKTSLSPVVMRVGSANVRLDVDGDGEGDVKIPLTGNLEPVEFDVGEGSQKRRLAFLAIVGNQQDIYQGVQVNLAPSDEHMTIYYIPAGSLVGEFAGVKIRVFDDNLDGTYGGAPWIFAHPGMSPGMFQPEMDSIVVGKEKRARPWSEYVEIGEKWCRLESVNGGMEIRGGPVVVETGTLKLKFKGGKPSWVVMRGEGVYESSYFDITGSGTEVPVGRYSLYYGELRKGKKRQMVKTLFVPGEATPTWDAVAGETTIVELGSPFSYDFKFEEDASAISVPGKNVVFTGVAYERYERPWGCVPQPDVSYRQVGSRRGSKPVTMEVVMDQDQLFELEWKAAWSPLDLILEKRSATDASELQLSEKKNKLFGKVASDWKQ